MKVCNCFIEGQGDFSREYLGQDPSDGRFADVYLEECKGCKQMWLFYEYEIESVSASLRFYRGAISDLLAKTATAKTAAQILENLEEYFYGGSYFGLTKPNKSKGQIF
ncbi:MAG: hypothetical protein WAQ98_15475 [Blastocatellia bacterium]